MPEPQGARIPAPRVHPPHAPKAMSNQQMIPDGHLDGSQLARVIVRIVGLGTGRWLLPLDRTCWKFGRHDINILMLAIIHNGIAIPVMWDVLGRAGTSTTAQRSALLSRFCAVFGEAAHGTRLFYELLSCGEPCG